MCCECCVVRQLPAGAGGLGCVDNANSFEPLSLLPCVLQKRPAPVASRPNNGEAITLLGCGPAEVIVVNKSCVFICQCCIFIFLPFIQSDQQCLCCDSQIAEAPSRCCRCGQPANQWGSSHAARLRAGDTKQQQVSAQCGAWQRQLRRGCVGARQQRRRGGGWVYVHQQQRSTAGALLSLFWSLCVFVASYVPLIWRHQYGKEMQQHAAEAAAATTRRYASAVMVWCCWYRAAAAAWTWLGVGSPTTARSCRCALEL